MTTFRPIWGDGLEREAHEILARHKAREDENRAALDRQIARAERDLIRFESKFHHQRRDGVEWLWLKGVASDRMIHGIASTPTINDHNYSLASEGMQAKLPVPLLSSHSKHINSPVGQVFYLRKSAKEIYIRATIKRGPAGDLAWDLIESGELRCLSVAVDRNKPCHVEAEVEGITFYDKWHLQEVSLCKQGANSDCVFEVFKR